MPELEKKEPDTKPDTVIASGYNLLHDRIKSLLQAGGESAILDYKSSIDVGRLQDLVELTKDIGAMMSSGGGAILIGADSKGVLVDDFTDDLYGKVDEAPIRNRVKVYISEPLDFTVSCTKYENHNVVLIQINGHQDGIVIFKDDGKYVIGDKEKICFRRGSVWARHGSSSETWQQHDLDNFIKKIQEKEKRDLSRDLEKKYDEAEKPHPIVPPKAEPKPEHNSAHFASLFHKQKLRLINGESTVSELCNAIDEVSIGMISSLKEGGEVDTFEGGLRVLSQFYNMGFQEELFGKSQNPIDPVEIWRSILIRLPIIGGVCIENGDFELAKMVASQKIKDDLDGYYWSWYRHALTMSARAEKLKPSLLVQTLNLIKEDKRYLNILAWTEEERKRFCASFDYIAALFAIDDVGSVEQRLFYPSFAIYQKPLIEGTLSTLLLNEKLRGKVLKSSREQLVELLQGLDQFAEHESWSWDDEWYNRKLKEFFDLSNK